MSHDENRRGRREPLTALVNFRKPKEMPYEVHLEDFSQYGCRIASRERLREGQLLWITIPGLAPLRSWVRWNGEWQAGLEFERPMHVAVFEHFTERMKDMSAAA